MTTEPQPSSNGRRFPVLRSHSDRHGPAQSIPWEWIAPHEATVLAEHSQDLETLARRGGLSKTELFVVLNDLRWRDMPGWPNPPGKGWRDKAVAEIDALLAREAANV